MKNKLTVIIAAAGESKRFKGSKPKPFIIIKNKPLIWYSLITFQNSSFVKEIYVVVSENNLTLALEIKKKYLKKITKLKNFIIGGKERSGSVFNALKFISENNGADFIAIHDAARPFLKPEMLIKTFTEALKFGACAPALAVIDTVKISDKNNLIINHPPRNSLKAIQTPQIFNFNKLFTSYKKSVIKHKSFTDDTEVYGMFNKKIKIVPGDNDLFKITYPYDLDVAKKIIKMYKNLWK